MMFLRLSFVLLLLTANGTAFAQAPEAPATAAPPAETPALPPVARVGKEIISGEEFQKNLDHFVRRVEAEQGRTVVPDRRIRMNVLNDLINLRILNMLASTADVTVSDEEVEQEFERRRRGIPTQTAYEGYLRREGLTEAELKEKIRERMLTERYIRTRTEGIAVSEEQVREEYDRWLKEGKLDRPSKTADFLHIFIGIEARTEASWTAAREQIDAARARIVAGESFEDVAREVSQDVVSAHRGGSYFEANETVMAPELGARLFELPIGEVSEPFRGERGWHLMKVISHNEPGQVSYEKVAGELKRGLEDQLRQRKLVEEVRSARNIVDIEVFEAAEVGEFEEEGAPPAEVTTTGEADATES